MNNEVVRTLAEAFTEVGGTLLIICVFAAWGWWDNRRNQHLDDE